jgi:hypothetical protein
VREKEFRELLQGRRMGDKEIDKAVEVVHRLLRSMFFICGVDSDHIRSAVVGLFAV